MRERERVYETNAGACECECVLNLVLLRCCPASPCLLDACSCCPAWLLCFQEECLQKKFVVFDSEIDLAGHTLQMHPNRPVKRQIQVSTTSRLVDDFDPVLFFWICRCSACLVLRIRSRFRYHWNSKTCRLPCVLIHLASCLRRTCRLRCQTPRTLSEMNLRHPLWSRWSLTMYLTRGRFHGAFVHSLVVAGEL